jgi:hypothetical protein
LPVCIDFGLHLFSGPFMTGCVMILPIIKPASLRDRDAWALLSFAVELCEHFVRNFSGDFEFSGVECGCDVVACSSEL